MKLAIEPHNNEPQFFRYKSSWYAVKTDQPKLLAEYFLSISDAYLLESIFMTSNWKVHVSSYFKGWTFFVSELAAGHHLAYDHMVLLITGLSKDFKEVQFFGNHRGVDYYCWGKAENGELTRMYHYLGGENYGVEGEPTEAESGIRLYNMFEDQEGDGGEIDQPDETMVMRIAGNWSIDPTQLSDEDFEKMWTNALVVKRVE